MCGIYMIKNKINGKVYIGQSIHIHKRFKEHIRHSKYSNSVIHLAIKKYGLENFEFNILILCKKDKLNELESKYIIEYNANNKENGYNIAIPGVDCVPAMVGELNGNSKMTSEDIISIRQKYNDGLQKSEVYKIFENKISKNTFQDIWIGKTWKHIMINVYTEKNKEYQKNNFNRSFIKSIPEEDILKIREFRSENKFSKSEIYENFKYININTFNDIWYNKTFKHIQATKKTDYKKFATNQSGFNNNNAKLTENDVVIIRTYKKQGAKKIDIYRDFFKDRISLSAFSNVWCNKTFKDIIV